MTMIEILVAFVMLTLVMVIMYSCMKFASNLLREATDIDRNNEMFEKVVADKFKDGTSYKLGSGNTVTYTFSGTDSTGASIPEFDYSVSAVNVSFKKTDDKYEITNDMTDNNVRKLYMFSTGD